MQCHPNPSQNPLTMILKMSLSSSLFTVECWPQAEASQAMFSADCSVVKSVGDHAVVDYLIYRFRLTGLRQS